MLEGALATVGRTKSTTDVIRSLLAYTNEINAATYTWFGKLWKTQYKVNRRKKHCIICQHWRHQKHETRNTHLTGFSHIYYVRLSSLGERWLRYNKGKTVISSATAAQHRKKRLTNQAQKVRLSQQQQAARAAVANAVGRCRPKIHQELKTSLKKSCSREEGPQQKTGRQIDSKNVKRQ